MRLGTERERWQACPVTSAGGQAGTEPLGHRPGLDGVRGFAIVLVLALHWWPTLFPGGYLGVDLFFVLSGFLITTLMLEDRDFRLARFYERRARRLMPAVAVLLAVFWWADGVEWAALYVANWARAGGELSPYLGHMWSLAIEEQFYLAWPLVFLGLRSCRRPVVVAALLAVAVGVGAYRNAMAEVVDGARLVNGTDMRLDGLALGCALAFGWPWLARFDLRRYVAPLAAVALAALGWVWVANADLTRWGYTIVSAGWLVVLVAVLYGSGHRLLTHRAMVRLGVLSYSLYLWHFPITAWVRGGSLYNTAAWSTVVSVVLSLAAAWVSYRFVEQRFRLRRAREQRTEEAGVVGEGVSALRRGADDAEVHVLARRAGFAGQHARDLEHVL